MNPRAFAIFGERRESLSVTNLANEQSANNVPLSIRSQALIGTGLHGRSNIHFPDPSPDEPDASFASKLFDHRIFRDA
jgi:hypothetical protein